MARKLWDRAWLGLLVSASCATPAAVEQDLSLLRRNVASLETEVRDLRKIVDRIDGQLTLLSLNGRPSGSKGSPTQLAGPATRPAGAPSGLTATASPSTRGAAGASALPPALPIVKFGGSPESEHAPTDDGSLPLEARDDGRPPILIQLGPSDSGDRIPVDPTVLEKPDPVLGAPGHGSSGGSVRSTNDPPKDRKGTASQPTGTPQSAGSAEHASAAKAEYELALKQLRDEDRPRAALESFKALEDKYPKSDLADNIRYWTGECHYALQAYDEAIKQFELVVRDHPRSAKVPYALVSTAESWLKLGRAGKARRFLKRVIETYPGTDAASRARARLASLGPRAR